MEIPMVSVSTNEQQKKDGWISRITKAARTKSGSTSGSDQGSNIAGYMAELRELAVTVYQENKLMNMHKGLYTKARSKLLGLMNAHEEISFVVPAGKDHPELNAVISTPEEGYIDVHELAKTVTLEELLSVVTATQKAVEEKFGKEVVARCLRHRKGTPNVSVKPAK